MTQEYHDKMGPPRDGKLKGVMHGRHESGTGFRGIELDPAEATLWMNRMENSDYRGRHERRLGVEPWEDYTMASWLERDTGVGPEVVSTREPARYHIPGCVYGHDHSGDCNIDRRRR